MPTDFRDTENNLPIVYRNTTAALIFNIIDEDEQPYDLTGALDITFVIGEYAGASARDLQVNLVSGITHGDVNGQINVILTDTQTGSLPIGDRWCDLFLRDADNVVSLLASGKITIKDNMISTVDPDAPEVVNEISAIQEFLAVAHNGDGTLKTIDGEIIEIDGDSLPAVIDTKAPIASPTFTGTPSAPTPSTGDSSTKIATTAHVHAVVDGIVDGAPEALDTLNELAAALGNDANFASSVSDAIALKAAITDLAVGNLPINLGSLSATYNNDGTLASYTTAGVVYTLTYNVDGSIATKLGGGHLWTYNYVAGSLISIVVS